MPRKGGTQTRSSVDLFMDCHDDNLSKAQVDAFEKAWKLYKESEQLIKASKNAPASVPVQTSLNKQIITTVTQPVKHVSIIKPASESPQNKSVTSVKTVSRPGKRSASPDVIILDDDDDDDNTTQSQGAKLRVTNIVRGQNTAQFRSCLPNVQPRPALQPRPGLVAIPQRPGLVPVLANMVGKNIAKYFEVVVGAYLVYEVYEDTDSCVGIYLLTIVLFHLYLVGFI